jgi:hypothetical protein
MGMATFIGKLIRRVTGADGRRNRRTSYLSYL